MKSLPHRHRQRGVALIVALLFLLVVTVISVIAASNSTLGLKMSANMADSSRSFQSAEAGIIAALSLVRTDEDPFNGAATDPNDPNDPFSGFDDCANAGGNHPLRSLNDPCSVDVEVFLTNRATACPRSATGSSVGLLDCDFYRVESEHEVVKRARNKVDLGVVKTVIGGASF